MKQYKNQKDYRTALNGKLIMMVIGVLLIFNGVTTSISRYAFGMYSLSKQYAQELQQNQESGAAQDGVEQTEISSAALTESDAGQSAAADTETINGKSENKTETDIAENETENVTTESETESLMESLQAVGWTVSLLRKFALGFLIVGLGEILAGVLSFIFANRLDKAGLVLKGLIVLLVLELAFQLYLMFHGGTSLSLLISAFLYPICGIVNAIGLIRLSRRYPEIKVTLPKEQKKKQTDAPEKPARSLKERAMVPKNLAAASQTEEFPASQVQEQENLSPAEDPAAGQAQEKIASQTENPANVKNEEEME